jgi:hypothetical protein
MHKHGLFDVDIMAWSDMKDNLRQNRNNFVEEVSKKYHCVVAFSEISMDLE